MKTCSKCKQKKTYDKFYKLKASKDGLQAWCRACLSNYRAAHREANGPRRNRPEVAKRAWLKYYYGLTPEDFETMLKEQGGVCKLCKGEFRNSKSTHIDHNHECCPGVKTCGECIRGILCASCNVFIGQLETRRDLLEDALDYVRILC